MNANDKGQHCQRDWQHSLLSLNREGRRRSAAHWPAPLSETWKRRLRTTSEASRMLDAPAIGPERACSRAAASASSEWRPNSGLATREGGSYERAECV